MSTPLSLLLFLGGCASEAPPPSAAGAQWAPVAEAPDGSDGPAAIPIPVFKVSTDPAVIDHGARVFETRGCGACHQFGTKLVGPDLAGVTSRRSPKWIARQILYPERMTREDPVAKQLSADLMVQMTNQRVDPSELAPLISYLAIHP